MNRATYDKEETFLASMRLQGNVVTVRLHSARIKHASSALHSLPSHSIVEATSHGAAHS
jgi:hypothetical protein